MGIGQEVLNVPFGEMVTQLASAVATSQAELDRSSVEIMKIMGDAKKAPVHIPYINEKGEEGEMITSMIGAGFQPTFYQFTDAIIEVKMAISTSTDREYEDSYEYTNENNSKTKKTSSVRTTTINANYTSKYNFSEEATSTLRVRLVPLPPNPTVQRFMDLRAQRQQLLFETEIKKSEAALELKKLEINK
ncbi:MAG: hypothetical protein LBM39_02225 [Candidatus Methanoplasma sp.]|jgi:hypothetical protein|nr:hypothetical protein [Candidatus Methanoplasma sp.]